MIVAVDGPAASGKGTIAAALGRHFNLPHLDTGLLYRAVGLAVKAHIDAPDIEARATKAAQDLDSAVIDPEFLLGAEVGVLASKIAVFPGVRKALFAFQRDFATQPLGAVLDGRDIGTTIAPEADAKLFIVADPQVRAARRARQLLARGQSVDREKLLTDIKARDARDAAAPHGGFHPADDAVLLDTTNLDIEAAITAAIAQVEAAIARKSARS
ncbi:cytidylate kinase [Pelagibacterium halotolerans B2]|uniref:Cytidylate kinase n=1 Tax=Pelagibacterium halotolerans (strain DSM 22347 / JCM 15775 / CGMCC 1.7692 / B2) TaxID=1082931 RepID=G4R9C5_PELHB|nr:(d)CMP kinase [Pelagibacterium halotolerans]AEQ53459.1 cytidylate kinase [Pelagibacterium halotolerans B2]